MTKSHWLAALALLASAGSARALDVTIGVGFDTAGTVESESGSSRVELDADDGFSLGLELTVPVLASLHLGGGIDYFGGRDLEQSEVEVETRAAFALARWLPLGEDRGLTLSARAGYADWAIDLPSVPGVRFDEQGGLHFGAGIGYRFTDQWSVEALWLRSEGEVDVREPDESFTDDLTQEMVSVRARYTF